ncbi:MAG: hypothetical protein R2852_01910 [Bacteroidia bacterium]
MVDSGMVEYSNFEDLYIKQAEENDTAKLKSYAPHFAYDAMYGVGQNVIRRMLPDVSLMHCTQSRF